MVMQISSMQTQQTIMGALKGSSQVMAKINEDMDVGAIRDVLKEFNKQMGKAEMQGDMVNDAFDMMEDPGMAQDADDVYSSILDEVGLQMSAGTAVSTKKIASKQQEVAVEEEEKDDLEARLAALRM